MVLQRHNYRPGNDTPTTCSNLLIRAESVINILVFLVAKLIFGGTKWYYKDIIIDPEMTLRRAETYFLAGRSLSIISCFCKQNLHLKA